jgi:hypothetical protein
MFMLFLLNIDQCHIVNQEHLLQLCASTGLGCREVNFVSDTVSTLAGNGEKGSDYKGGRKGMAQASIYGSRL